VVKTALDLDPRLSRNNGGMTPATENPCNAKNREYRRLDPKIYENLCDKNGKKGPELFLSSFEF
jgi:hypothetical protein